MKVARHNYEFASLGGCNEIRSKKIKKKQAGAIFDLSSERKLEADQEM